MRDYRMNENSPPLVGGVGGGEHENKSFFIYQRVITPTLTLPHQGGGNRGVSVQTLITGFPLEFIPWIPASACLCKHGRQAGMTHGVGMTRACVFDFLRVHYKLTG